MASAAASPESASVEELDSAPSLAPLYARAVAGSVIPGGRAGELPEQALALREVEIDLDLLARYARVCGYRLGAALPPTYPHIVGFPLEMKLMSARSFPFALLGMVHVANRIQQLRSVPVDARPDVLVWAQDLRPHRRGRQFDVVTELRLEGEPAWREHSTYLSSGGGSEEDSAGRGDRGPDLAEAAAGGDHVASWSVPGDIGRRYADVSGDRNPIHMHSLAAKPFGFPGAIAHGMWMKARCLAALEGRLGAELETAVEFRRPLRIPGRVRLRLARQEGSFAFALESPEDSPHLVGMAGRRS